MKSVRVKGILFLFALLLLAVFLFYGFSLGMTSFSVLEPATTQSGQCFVEWSCIEWSNCTYGKQVRSCVDLNNCGIRLNMPEVELVCEVFDGNSYEFVEVSCVDGLDNDCDGRADELDVDCRCNLPGIERFCPLKMGVCSGAKQRCGADNLWSCDYGLYYERREVSCGDFRDNDCDGYVDCYDEDCMFSGGCFRCVLNRAYWSKSFARNREFVDLVVEGSDCDGLVADFDILRADSNELVKKGEAVFEQGRAFFSWRVLREEVLTKENLQYVFKVRVKD